MQENNVAIPRENLLGAPVRRIWSTVATLWWALRREENTPRQPSRQSIGSQKAITIGSEKLFLKMFSVEEESDFCGLSQSPAAVALCCMQSSWLLGEYESVPHSTLTCCPELTPLPGNAGFLQTWFLLLPHWIQRKPYLLRKEYL